MEICRFSTLFNCYCLCTTLLLIFTITAIVEGGLLIKDKGKKGQIIVFGKPCMPTLIKTGGKKGKQLIVLPAENGNGQNCGKQEGGGLQGGGYGSSGSSYYGNSYYGNGGYGRGSYSHQNSFLYSSPMMITSMPSRSNLYRHQMMANMKMQKMMLRGDMSSGYGSDRMTMMPVYSSSGLGMSGENKHDSLRMNTYGSSKNNENSRPMHTDSSYKTGRPMMKSENKINRGQYEVKRNHDNEKYSGKTENEYSMVSGSGYERELQNDDYDDQLLQQKRQQMHVNSVENMLPEKSEMQESSRSWRKKADDEMMHAMASMLVRSRFQAPDMKH